MRKIVVSEFMSLDGVIESPQNWHFPFVTDDMMQEVKEQIHKPEVALYGRVTYQEFASYWPTAGEDELGIAGKINSVQKYVVSNTLNKADWQNTTIIKGGATLMDEIAKLKQDGDGIIAMTGSAKLAQSLMQCDLIDEYRLLIHPVVVGKGLRLFQDGITQTLKLVETRTFNGGVVLTVYQPERSPIG